MNTLRTFACLALVATLASASADAQTQNRNSSRSNNNDKPDLVIAKIQVDASDNEIKVSVKNIGDSRADDSKVRLEIRIDIGFGPGQTVFNQLKNVDDLGRNDDDTVKFDVNFAQLNQQVEQVQRRLANSPGIFNRFEDRIRLVVIATADAQNQVNEKNENNNRLTRLLPTP